MKKKIIFITPTAPPVTSAARIRITSFYDILNKKYELTILSKDPNSKSDSKYNIDIFSNDYNLLKKLLQIRPDLIIASTPNIRPCAVATMYAKSTKTPIIVDVRDPQSQTLVSLGRIKRNGLKHKAVKILEKIAYSWSTEVTFVSEYLMEKTIKQHKIKSSKVIANGVEISKFRFDKKAREKIRKKLAFNKKDLIIIYQGIVAEEKELDSFFLNVAPTIVKKYNAKFLFIVNNTKNKSYEDMKKAIKKKKLEKNYFEIANIPYEDMYKYISVADIALNPLSEEMDYCIPVKFFEYLACEVVVISKGKLKGGLYQVYEEGYAKELFVNKQKEIIKAIEIVIKTDTKNIKKKGINLAEKYSREQIAKKMKGEVERLIK